MFWTVLLHCLLDKGSVARRRRVELETAAREMRRPSPGEAVFAAVCPPDWSPDRVVHAVAARDWDAVSLLAQRMAAPAPPVARSALVAAAQRRAVRRVARAAYSTLWRRAGLGATPAVLDVVKEAGTAGIVANVHRRPGLCQVDLVVSDDHAEHRLAPTMRAHGYRLIAGAWLRATPVGLERVRAFRPGDLAASTEEGAERRSTSRPVRPVRVSFSGLDGAGKSQQIARLVASLGQECSVDVVWLPTKVWPEPLLNRLPAGLRSGLGPKRTAVLERGPDTPPQRRGAANRLRSVVWTTIGTVAALSVGSSLHRRASTSSADVVVLDRYRLDSLVKLCIWYTEAPVGWLTGIVRTLAPAADVEVLLRVDPAIAHARKAEQWSVAQLTRQARLYDRLAATLGVIVLDGQQPPEDVARAVGSHLRSVLRGRPDGRRDGR
jgi:thymidylate kinase